MGRIMGVDVGSVRVGVALSDELGITAAPLRTIARKTSSVTARDIVALAAAEGADRIVVGLPLAMDGGEQASAADAREVAEAIRRAGSIPVVLWDERLTSLQAERALIEANTRREKRKQLIDKVAAALILQSFLDVEKERSRQAGDPEAGGS